MNCQVEGLKSHIRIHGIMCRIIVNPAECVTSRRFSPQHFELRVSDPRTIAYVRFEMPSESANLPGSGRGFEASTFENRACGQAHVKIT